MQPYLSRGHDLNQLHVYRQMTDHRMALSELQVKWYGKQEVSGADVRL